MKLRNFRYYVLKYTEAGFDMIVIIKANSIESLPLLFAPDSSTLYEIIMISFSNILK